MMHNLIAKLHYLHNRILFDLFIMFMISSSDKYSNMDCPFASIVPVVADHRITTYRRNQAQNLPQQACADNSGCTDNTHCNQALRKCQCNTDLIQVGTFVNISYISHRPMTCLPIARLDERCTSDHQCIVDYSECRLITTGNNSATSHYCKCTSGHEENNETAEILLNGHTYRVRPICRLGRIHSTSWLNTLILISILVILILIGTFVAIVRYQRWRNLPFPSTMTSIAGQSGMNSHMGNNRMASSSPPPMGSVEAEFQNDFIQVFPMHHLEPMPDKNVHEFMNR